MFNSPVAVLLQLYLSGVCQTLRFSFSEHSTLVLDAWSSWPVWHKQCHISDQNVLYRITRREWSGGDVRGPVWGSDRRIVSQPVPYPQTGRCPLSLRGRLLTRGEPGGCWNEETWELLRGWAGHLMSSTRAGCDAEWAEGERQPLQSVTKAWSEGWGRKEKYWAQTDYYYISIFVRKSCHKTHPGNLCEFSKSYKIKYITV